jgi:N6-L-threonylcarbamoyladenine synthase
MKVLGIETSCDETSAAIVDDHSILSNIIATQAIHSEYGGVVPEFASRAHIRQLAPIIQMALEEAKCDYSDIDGIAVTYGPGLAGSLLVGLGVAKGLATSVNKPFIGINHIEGHILATAADNPEMHYPFIALVVSGGHSILVLAEKPLSFKIIGQTIDDAAGEAFDKVAKVLDLGYPGGPLVEKAAKTGDERSIDFPRALMEKDNLNFSFSGLKTSVLYYVQAQRRKGLDVSVVDVAASFQRAVIDVLIKKAFRALTQYNIKNLILAGGVARNSALRQSFEKQCEQEKIDLRIPAPLLCTDNAGMIARAGHMRLSRGESSNFNLDVFPNLSLNNHS